ncbi:MAG: heme-binding beta-barrel domain-containing protein [Gammaproteobacteria bacterium]|nr:heme-binding beta-barrel domain-containing protein [Gammaproteobacteria bacterium]
MSEESGVDYGPLAGLIGTWAGEEGLDVAPEPEGTEVSPYRDSICFEAVGDVTNADSQTLAAVRYQQVVRRSANDEIFHDECGYWLWDAREGVVMHSLLIPRGVGLLAGGRYAGKTDADGRVVLEVAAGVDNPEWGIIQSPFMEKNARTLGFEHRIAVGSGRLSYSETTWVDIYGKVFRHTDRNELRLVE